ncbi:hypothetical protein Tco_0832383 [Tanacetum coccineum]
MPWFIALGALPLVVDVITFLGVGDPLLCLLKAISVVVNLLLEGRCPKVLAEFVASAPLTPLLKNRDQVSSLLLWRDGGGLASKEARGCQKEMSKYLGDFQFGVGVHSGAEAVLQQWRTIFGPRLGVSAGGPLRPLSLLYFAPTVHLIDPGLLPTAIMLGIWNDGTIIKDTKKVVKAIDIIRAEGPLLGLELNIKKTEVFWPSCNGVKVKDGLFPRDIGRPTLGVKLLGGAVSRDAGFISSLAVKRASRAVELMSLLPSLRDP